MRFLENVKFPKKLSIIPFKTIQRCLNLYKKVLFKHDRLYWLTQFYNKLFFFNKFIKILKLNFKILFSRGFEFFFFNYNFFNSVNDWTIADDVSM